MKLAFVRICAALVITVPAAVFATTPPSHNVTIPTTPGDTVVVEWTGTSPPGAAGGANTCVSGIPAVDGHIINLTVPSGAYDTVKVSAAFHIEWDNSASDLVLSVEKDGTNVGDSDGGTPEENVSVNDPAAGKFEAIACSFAAIAPTAIRGRLTLTATSTAIPPDVDGDGVLNENDACPGTPAGTAVDVDGCPLPTASGLAPRFQIHVAPQGMGDDAGEPSVGYNKFTQRTMFISYVNALRQTYHETVVPQVLPASCPALWEDKSGLLTTVNSLDPILFTDEATGRTFNSQLSGANSFFEFSDDDGENWTVAQQGPPNGGADHQAVASGPYPAANVPPTARWPATGPKRAVYYCSQSVGTAFCSRSDDGGQVFGPGFTFKNTDCGAGALHGHVKVAPDGTVYVPDSSQCVLPIGGTADHVIAFRSDNAGQTWSVKDVPSSTGGAASDPSIGIATDGTLYMCYEDGNSHVRMAVSKDKGDTWINDIDIGASHGIVQTRFPHAIAGDPNRGACAFLGTTTPGNGSSLAFEGEWHGYIATTYDGGLTYHLANVTPFDPVQGYGGVGPSGTNRNLLDFNDLQLDDQGRLLFGFADGCIGACVQDPSANGFAAKATIIRQSGGRTLFASFDNMPATQYNNPTPIKPAPACARQDLSVRTDSFSKVVWNAPDTGGSRITNYEVSRATGPAGPFTLLGSSGTETSFIDTTADPQVEKYYYKVVAQNSVNKALDSNVIDLTVTVVPIVDTCSAPGDIVITDPTGDSSPPADDMEIVFVGVAEPEALADNFVFTYKVVKFSSGVPPTNAFYAVMFPTKGNLYVAMNAVNPAAPSYEYGTFAVSTVTTFTKVGNLNAASGYKADGTITLVAPRTLFGSPAIGDVIPGFEARARIVSNTTSRDTTATGDYTVRGSTICVQPTVLAELSALTNAGNAPLAVTFKLSGTVAEGESLDSYSILFGDESGASPAPTTGSFGGLGSVQVSHTYQSGGTFRALLTVTDSAGTASTNLAEETITVIGSVTPSTGAGNGDNTQLGGALPSLSLLLLSLLGLARRYAR